MQLETNIKELRNNKMKCRDTCVNDKCEQYEITENERDRYCDYENQDDDECMRQMNAQDKYRFVTECQNRASHDAYDARAHYTMAPALEHGFKRGND